MPPQEHLSDTLRRVSPDPDIQIYPTNNNLITNPPKETLGSSNLSETKEFKQKLYWGNIIGISVVHFLALWACCYIHKGRFLTYLWALFIGGVGGFGVTGGAHRLWSHRSYKAKLPLQIILLICYSVAGQNTIYEWVRDHRVHHKFSETDADPHNANRGFFFSHVGWLMQRKHPEVYRRGTQVDLSDITKNRLLMFHVRYHTIFKLIFCFALPIMIPVYFWDESWFIATLGVGIFRYVCNLNFTWLVNSAAHMFGTKPYDKKISPTQNLAVSIVAMGEGWHNYHHVFPWDYKAAELGNYKVNVTTFWLDQFAKIGWAYDLKSPSKDLVKKIVEKYGDGSHDFYHHHEEVNENGEVIDTNRS